MPFVISSSKLTADVECYSYSFNKCIRHNTKAAAHRSPNCIRKTKNTVKNNFQCGSAGIMTLNSPGDSTLQCGTWLWDDMSSDYSRRRYYLLLISRWQPQWRNTTLFRKNIHFCFLAQLLEKVTNLNENFRQNSYGNANFNGIK